LTTFTRERELTWLPLEQIQANPKNPRQAASFTEEALSRLRSSVRVHGILEALIVMPEPGQPGTYRLIEGERRLRVAKLESLTEVPVVIVNDMSEHDQVVTMFNLHQNRRGWEMAEELVAVAEIVQRNGQESHEELATQLGMTVATFRDRLAVLNMGTQIVDDIATGKVEYTAVLRSNQAAATIGRHRPKLVQKLGGDRAVEGMLLDKAKTRKRGVSQELVQARADLADASNVPDAVVEQYLRKPDAEWRELLQSVKPADDRRKVRELAKRLADVQREVRAFDPKTLGTSQLSELRRSVVGLMTAGQDLEQRIVDALLERN